MSHYADSVLAERPSFLDPVYYDRPQTYGTVTSVAPPAALPSSRGPTSHANSIWTPFCEDPAPLVQPVAFAGYDTAEHSAAQSSLYSSPWQSATLPSATASAISIPGFQQSLAGPSSPQRYRALGVPSSVAAYPHRSPSQSPSLYESSNTFRNQRNRSPDSQVSTLEHTGWTSSQSTTDDAGSSSTSRDEGDDVCTPGGDSDVPMQSLAIQTSSSSWMPPVKVEPEESTGCFIMELPPGPSNIIDSPVDRNSLQAWQDQLVDIPAEVPLRATGASKRMRRMMNAFRVNPFSMHSLSVRSDDGGLDGEDDDQSQATWCGGEARPLDEEPRVFEFQLDLEGFPVEEMEFDDQDAPSRPRLFSGSDGTDETKLRSFSPDFELHPVSEGDHDEDDIPSLQQAPIFDADRQSDVAHQYYDQESEYTQFQSRDTEPSEDGDSITQSEAGSQTATTAQVHGDLHGSNHGTFPMHDYHHGPPSRASVSGWDTTGKIYPSTRYDPNVPPSPSAQAGPHFGYDGVKVSKPHSTSSHPYLRKSLQNQHAHKMPDPQHAISAYMPTGRFLLAGQAAHSAPSQTYPLNQAHQAPRVHHDVPLPDMYQSMKPNNTGTHQILPIQEPTYGVGEAFQPSYMRIIRDSRDPNAEHVAGYRLPGDPNSGVRGHIAPSSMTCAVDQISTSSASQSAGGYSAASSSSLGVNHRRWSLPEAMGNHGVAHFSG
ncbi:hypothetical protein D9619_007986 [Psilocybe cf. subviscida]|uniref:Uncharacterized protein n=1 Tax=Psilocybe cf. subviscida TaxID=2480587 RepID=A0A8H5ESS9_9AGAR|nr:hypothetical protein D9619_007986 [Psilocybe cf. subviscida]